LFIFPISYFLLRSTKVCGYMRESVLAISRRRALIECN
jgi:hypothetical protein